MKLLLTAILASCALSAAMAADNDDSLLSYRWHGGRSPYRKVAVEILESGKTKVTISKTKDFLYETTLSLEEMAGLQILIDSTDFFFEPDREQSLREHSGETELTVSRPGVKQPLTLKFGYRPALEPLRTFLWKLVTQGDAVHQIETDGEVYTAAGTVNPRHGQSRVLQPDRLKQPLMAYIRQGKNRQKIGWALEGLVWLMTPEEYLGFIAGEFAKPDRRDLVPAYVGSDSDPQVLCPLYLAYARDYHRRSDTLTRSEKTALEGFVNSLGYYRYEPAIPFLTSLFARCQEKAYNPSLPPLSEMGLAGLDALIPFLDSKKELQRCHAIIAVVRASRGNPKSGFSRPYSEETYQRMVPVFEKAILPRLRVMAKDDPSAEVRRNANEAIAEIPVRIAK